MDFYCGECDMVIREEDVIIDKNEIEVWGHTDYETWLFCPKCGEPISEFKGEPYTSEYNNPFEDVMRGAFDYD